MSDLTVELSTASVVAYGATGDGTTDDAPALQRALDSGCRHLTVPMGVYRVGQTLRIGSGTRLDIHPEATLILADGVGQGVDDFLLTNRNHDRGDRDIDIRGGIWHGNNRGNRRVEPLIQPGAYTGVMLNFRNVEGLRFSHAMLRDAESYSLRLTQVRGFVLEHLRFHTQHPRPNNDGVHLTGFCERGVIRYLRGLGPAAPSDDLVAMNADDAIHRVECQGGLCGPIRDITVHDLKADQCHSFVRLLSTDSPIERIEIDRIRGGCTTATLNMDAARGCRVPVVDPKDPRYASGLGNCRQIRVSDVVTYKAAANDGPMFRLEQLAEGLTVTDFQRDVARDAAPAAPTVSACYLPDHRLTLEGLTADQVQATREAISAPLASRLLTRDQPRRLVTLTAPIRNQEHFMLPDGGFDRLTIGAEE
ncbi:MAG: hypothetical protein WD534_02620 [Phycisphaeraceae bacterium]